MLRRALESGAVADFPDGLTARRNRDASATPMLLARWTATALISAVLVLGLFNVFGQKPDGDTVENDTARFEVFAPTKLRGGLFYEGRFTVEAKEDIESATIVLDPGWMESMHINTIEPSPVGEASRDGKLALDFGHIAAGGKLVAYLQFQVNPTNVGRRSQDAVLADGESPLLSVDRDVTVYP